MNFFYSVGASSLAPHILLDYLSVEYEPIKLELNNKLWKPESFEGSNSELYVPVLTLDNGVALTEVTSILEYVAKNFDSDNILGEYNSKLYWKQRMWLNYIAAELHENFLPLFHFKNWLPNTSEIRKLVIKRITPRFNYIDTRVNEWKKDLNSMSVVDPYLFVMISWMDRLAMDLNEYPNLKNFYQHMYSIDSVRKTLKSEGKPHSLVENNRGMHL
ncbi:glutathione S-transferase [Enterococcus faecalis]|nr:glutathione S-transferase [Enterococcus faecalis]